MVARKGIDVLVYSCVYISVGYIPIWIHETINLHMSNGVWRERYIHSVLLVKTLRK